VLERAVVFPFFLMNGNVLAMSSCIPQGAIAYRFCWQLFLIFFKN
jgi:hypothetical protein